MAYDPDLQPILDTISARLDALEAGGGGGDDALTESIVAFHAAFYGHMNTLDTDAERVAFIDGLRAQI